MVFFPVVTIVHELGHAFFVKIFGGEIFSIGFGSGKKIFKVKKFYVGSKVVLSGRVYWENEKKFHLHQSILILLGGILFNVVSASLIWFYGNIQYADLYRGYIIYSYFMAFVSLLPFTFSDGVRSDGLQIIELLKEKYISGKR